MKKVLVAILLLCVSATAAFAQCMPSIGIYEDPDYTFCYGDIEVYVFKDVYIVANFGPEIPGITAVEFGIDNLPEAGAAGIRTDTWTSDLVIGDPGWDVSVAWPSAQPGPYVLIGTMSFFMTDPLWIGGDHLMMVVEGQDCGCLVIVDDQFETINAFGGNYTFGCSDPANCGCFPLTATQDASWGSLKALY